MFFDCIWIIIDLITSFNITKNADSYVLPAEKNMPAEKTDNVIQRNIWTRNVSDLPRKSETEQNDTSARPQTVFI